jgi:NAD(P)H-hydrate epimerase
MAAEYNGIEVIMIRLTRAQVREIDRISIEQYHIPGIVLMENASRGVADVALRMLPHARNPKILVLCGGGNNGGDGLAAARHLHNAGCNIQIAVTIDPARYQGDALVNWKIIQAMQLPVAQATPTLIESTKSELILDAIFGTGLTQAPRSPFDKIIESLDGRKIPILAIDLPSGLDCDTGQPLGTCVRATRTVTFVAEKVGFQNPEAKQYLGEVEVAEIGCPREVAETRHEGT